MVSYKYEVDEDLPETKEDIMYTITYTRNGKTHTKSGIRSVRACTVRLALGSMFDRGAKIITRESDGKILSEREVELTKSQEECFGWY